MSSFAFGDQRHRARRRGQALLLAVLIIIVAALLGSTFVLLVAVRWQPARTSPSMSPRGAAHVISMDEIPARPQRQREHATLSL